LVILVCVLFQINSYISYMESNRYFYVTLVDVIRSQTGFFSGIIPSGYVSSQSFDVSQQPMPCTLRFN